MQRLRLPLPMVSHKARGSSLHRLSRRLIILPRDLLICAGPPQPFDPDVVERPSSTGHAEADTRRFQAARKGNTGPLCPLIRVEHLRLSPRNGLLERLQTQTDSPRDRYGPRQHLPAAPIQHRYEGENAAREPDRRHVRPPDVLDPCERYAPQPVRIDPMRRVRLAQAGWGIHRLQTHRAEEPSPSCAVAILALAPQPGRHATPTILRCLRRWRIPQAPQRPMRSTLSGVSHLLHIAFLTGLYGS